jgi:hypothetical protein
MRGRGFDWLIACADIIRSFGRRISRGLGDRFPDPDGLATLREQLVATNPMLEFVCGRFRNTEEQRTTETGSTRLDLSSVISVPLCFKFRSFLRKFDLTSSDR